MILSPGQVIELDDKFITNAEYLAIDNISYNTETVVYDVTTATKFVQDVYGVVHKQCSSHSLEYIKKYGLDLNNLDSKSSPAKHARTLSVHLNSFLSSMQQFYAGALGIAHINIMYAPYIEHMDDKQLYQEAQHLVFQTSQNAYSRGGQSVKGDEKLIIHDRKTDTIIYPTIREFHEKLYEDNRFWTLSLNKETGCVEWKLVYGSICHKRANKLMDVTLSNGSRGVFTEDHSLFTIDGDCKIVETVTSKAQHVLVPFVKTQVYTNLDLIKYNGDLQIDSLKLTYDVGLLFGAYVGHSVIIDDMTYIVVNNLQHGELLRNKIRSLFKDVKIDIIEKGKLFNVVINDVRLTKLFAILCGDNATNKRIPNEILFGPEESLRGFIYGYTAANNKMSDNKVLTYTTSSLLHEQLHIAYSKLNIKSKKEYNKPADNVFVNIIGLYDFNNIIKQTKTHDKKNEKFIDYNYNMVKAIIEDTIDVGFMSKFTDIDTNVLLEVKDLIEETYETEEFDLFDGVNRILNVIPYKAFVSESKCDDENVYDISVADNENFVLLSGIVAHNTLFVDFNIHAGVPRYLKDIQAIGPGGKYTGKTYGDYEDAAIRFACALLKVWGEGDANGALFAFPKCLDKNTMMFYKIDGDYKVGTIYDVYQSFVFGHEVYVPHPTKSWVKVKRAAIGRSTNDGIKIELPNNIKLASLPDHKCVVLENGNKNIKLASDLQVGDVLVCDGIEIDHRQTDIDDQMTTLLGYSIANCTYDDNNNIGFVNDNILGKSIIDLLNNLKISFDICDNTIVIRNQTDLLPIKNLVPCDIKSRYIPSYLFTANNDTKTMFINAIFGHSNIFRSPSKNLVYGLKILLSSLGITSTIYDHKLHDDKLYDVVIHSEFTKSNMAGHKSITNYSALPILKIDKCYVESIAIEVDSDDHLFITGDGILTGNCDFHINDDIFNDPKQKAVFDLACKVASKNGSVYFVFDRDEVTLSACCRLRTTIKDDYMITNPESLRFTGFQNVTINLPQCAYRSKKDINAFYKELENTFRICVQAHLEKKKFIKTLMSSPNMPLWQVGMMAKDGRPYIDLEKATYIVGVIGLNECVKYLFDKELHEGEEILYEGLKIISHLYLLAKEAGNHHKLKFSLEESPAESASRRLAKIDIRNYKDAIVRGDIKNDQIYYTNSVHIRPDINVDIITRIMLQSKFHKLIESGAIIHAFVGEKTPSPRSIANLVHKVFKETNTSQLTISPEFTICIKCGKTSVGLRDKCQYCGAFNINDVEYGEFDI